MYEFDASISSAVSTANGRRSATARRAAVARSSWSQMQRYWARRQLPDRRADLPAGQCPAARAAAAGAHQAATARPLGHVARPQPHLHPPEPADQGARRQRDLPGRPGPRRPGAGGATRTSRARTRRSIRRSRRTWQGMRSLCRRFSTPGGIPSHVSVQTPGSIHEGGELGYVLSHAFGAAFDNPDLIVAAVVGDGEAESGPLAGAWKGTSFLNPVRDGAVLPILHLNGYKISGPTVLGRDSDDDIRAFLQGNGYEAHFVEGDDPRARAPGVRRDARPLLRPHSRDPARGPAARRHRAAALAGDRAAHAQGMDGSEGGGRPSRWRARSARTRCRWRTRATTRSSSRSSRAGCAATSRRTLFDADGKFDRRAGRARAAGRPPHERQPARERRQGAGRPGHPRLPRLRGGGRMRTRPASRAESTRQFGKMLRDIYVRNAERRTSACSAPTRRTPTASATSSRSRTAASSGARSTSTITCRRTAASWRCSASTSARAGSRAIS